MRRKYIDIERMCELYDKSLSDLADELFPDKRSRVLMLKKYVDDESRFTLKQLSIVAKFFGMTESELLDFDGTYKDQISWKGTSENGCLAFHFKNYKAILNFDGVFLRIYKDNVIIHEEISMTTPALSIGAFTDFLTLKIQQHESVSNCSHN